MGTFICVVFGTIGIFLLFLTAKEYAQKASFNYPEPVEPTKPEEPKKVDSLLIREDEVGEYEMWCTWSDLYGTPKSGQAATYLPSFKHYIVPTGKWRVDKAGKKAELLIEAMVCEFPSKQVREGTIPFWASEYDITLVKEPIYRKGEVQHCTTGGCKC